MEGTASALKAVAAAAMACLGFYSFAQTPLYADVEAWIRSMVGPVSLGILVPFFAGLIAGAGGRLSARIVYLSAFLLHMPSILSCSDTKIFGARLQTTMSFDQVLVVGILIQVCYLTLSSISSAERSYVELVRRGAERKAAREVFSNQLSLSGALIALSFMVPLVMFFSFVLARGGIAAIASGVPFSTFFVPLAFSVAIVFSVLLYLASVKKAPEASNLARG